MYYQSSARPNDPSEPETDRLKTLLDNLNNLRGKLKNFTVIDELGQPIGEISDLILDAGHQLNLVISQPDEQGQQPSVLLNGRRIRKVSVQTQAVFVDITKADVRFLPEYLLPDDETLAEHHSVAEHAPLHPSSPPTAFPEATSEIEEVPPFGAASPDFSLDVMESPPESTPSGNNDFLAEALQETDFVADSLDEVPSLYTSTETTIDEALSLEAETGESLDVNLLDWNQQDVERADTATAEDDFDFLELSEKPESDTPFEGLSELELPNEARSLDEFTLLDSQELNSTSDSAATDANPVPENYTLTDLDESQDEWADFDRMMGEESAETGDSFDLGSTLDVEGLDTNPVSEAFTLAELEASDRPSQPLPDLSFETSESLPELDLLAEDNLSDWIPESSESLVDLDLMGEEEPLPELSFETTESLASSDLTLEEDSFADFNLEDSNNLPELNLAPEDELATSLPDLDMADVANQYDQLPDLDLGNEPADEALVDLDFGLEDSSELERLSLSDEVDEPEETVQAPIISGLDNLDFGDNDEQPQDELGFAGFDFAPLPETTEPLPDLNLEANETFLTNEPSEDADAIAFIEENELLDLDLDELNAEPGVTAESELLHNDVSESVLESPTFTLADSSPDTIESLADLDFSDENDDVFELEPTEATANFNLADSLDHRSLEEDDSLELDNELLELDSSLLGEETTDISDFGTPPLDELDTPLTLDLDEESEYDPLAIADVSPESTASFVEPSAALNLDDLELSSVPLDLPDIPISAVDEATSLISDATQSDVAQPEFGLESVPALTYDLSNSSTEALSDSTSTSETTLPIPDTVDAIVPLLEERLKVEYERRKVGEVVIRKRIETRMVQVPVRYEKLIIEQVGGDKPLAEVDLSQGALDAVELSGVVGKPLVNGEFKSAKTASYVLDAIAKTLRHRCKNVRIEIELDDPKLQQAYQDWLNQCSQM